VLVTSLGAVVRGAIAGAAGTVAMDAVWYTRYRRGGGEAPPLQWEFSLSVQRWEDAPAPAQLGHRLAEAFLQREIPVEKAALVNDVMHWGYGLAWGSIFGVVAGSQRVPRAAVAALGPLFGAAVWASSYVTLPLAKLYKPIWEYDIPTLAKDLTAHLAYGTVTATTFAALRDSD
jgi:hypothetical protein